MRIAITSRAIVRAPGAGLRSPRATLQITLLRVETAERARAHLLPKSRCQRKSIPDKGRSRGNSTPGSLLEAGRLRSYLATITVTRSRKWSRPGRVAPKHQRGQSYNSNIRSANLHMSCHGPCTAAVHTCDRYLADNSNSRPPHSTISHQIRRLYQGAAAHEQMHLRWCRPSMTAR